MNFSQLSTTEILEKYNKLAEKVNLPTVKRFSDRKTAIMRLEGLMSRYEEKKPISVEKSVVKKQPSKKRENIKIINPIEFKVLRRSMFRTIKKLKSHPGKAFRKKRWELYKDGMTMYEIARTEGLSCVEVNIWVKAGLMELIQPTEEYYQKMRSIWKKK